MDLGSAEMSISEYNSGEQTGGSEATPRRSRKRKAKTGDEPAQLRLSSMCPS